MGTEFQIICDKCLRTAPAPEPDTAPEEACGQCGGTWLGPYAVARRFAPREGLQLVVSNQYVAAYADGADGLRAG